MNYFNLIKKTVKNPVLLKEIGKYLENDLSTVMGRHHYKHPIIFIAGLPKSGTTWLSTMLARIPGYNIRPIHDPKRKTYDHDIEGSLFAALPKKKYSIVKLHTRYTEENYAAITKYVPKFIVMYRDLRDMCVSRYFHVKAEHGHRHHQLYCDSSIKEGLTHSIDIVDETYVDWVKDWLHKARAVPDKILLVKYEDLNTDPMNVLKQINQFFDMNLDDPFLESLIGSKIKKEQSLDHVNDMLPGRLKSTARKGIVGDWKNYFDHEHKARFKEVAGDILIESGYEQDKEW